VCTMYGICMIGSVLIHLWVLFTTGNEEPFCFGVLYSGIAGLHFVMRV
jgi:hypothetical protein